MRHITIVLFSLFLSLLIIEGVLQAIKYPYIGCERISNLSENHIAKFDNKLGWDYIPHKSTIGDYNVSYTFNKEGYRAEDITYSRNLTKPVILIVGDSMMFGHGIQFTETFGYKLQKKLQDNYEVLNFAVQAYGTDQMYIKLQKLLPIYKPEIVIIDLFNDHPRRNINRDRRDFFECAKVIGTKPMFTIIQDKPMLTYLPEKYETFDNPRTLLLIRRFIHNLEYYNLKGERGAHKTGLPITSLLINEIREYVKTNDSRLYEVHIDFNVPDLDNNQHVLDVSIQKDEYIISKKDTHPNPKGVTYMVDMFMEKFGHEL